MNTNRLYYYKIEIDESQSFVFFFIIWNSILNIGRRQFWKLAIYDKHHVESYYMHAVTQTQYDSRVKVNEY